MDKNNPNRESLLDSFDVDTFDPLFFDKSSIRFQIPGKINYIDYEFIFNHYAI